MELEKGIAMRAKLAMMAPMRKKGFRRPNLGDHVPSLMAPIIGCTNSPVTGPAATAWVILPRLLQGIYKWRSYCFAVNQS